MYALRKVPIEVGKGELKYFRGVRFDMDKLEWKFWNNFIFNIKLICVFC